MCGIAGIFNLDGIQPGISIVKKMTETLSHRGPDDEGYYHKYNIALGHKRLSILDTSNKGRQPMISKDGLWVVVFNGCIYNFRELKKELIRKGHKFISSSDTEVLVEGLSCYGIDFIQRLNGMFAIGAFNTIEKKLYISRDRYGVKPLYYLLNGKNFIFSSEIKAILKFPDYKTDINNDSLNEYFTFQNLFTFRTLFKDIYLLPPANTILIDKNTKEIKHNPWWDYNFSEPNNKITFSEAKEETLRLFKQAIKRQMVSDVPLGAYLSGGMDSGSVVSVSSKYVERLTTFTCGFDMSNITGFEANYDERREAELMSAIFNTEHYEQVINSADLKFALPQVIWHMEDLRVGMTYPNYYISRLASKFVKVCLQGTGGDELYGGYPWRYYRVFKSLSQKDFFNNYYDFWQRLVNDRDKVKLFNQNLLKRISIEEPRKIFERVFTFNNSLEYDTPENHIQNSLYFEIKTFLHGLLVVGDKLSMANSLEERFPFLDNDLVDFAQKIPVKYKLSNLEIMKNIDENDYRNKRKLYSEFNDGKSILREAMSELLPKEILNRKKQGFSSPEENWYRGDNSKYIKNLLLGKNYYSGEFINQKFVRKILNEHINHKMNHRLLIWSLISFEIWCRKFLMGK
ncbi:MAG: asparagine synthase (glutamine-hydrolyzing) [Ignavibacteriaceae bacterium]